MGIPTSPETIKEGQPAKIFAENKVGLYKPQDIHQSLQDIAEANGFSEWGVKENAEQMVSYYLGYAVMTDLIHKKHPNFTTPFLGVDQLPIPNGLLEKPIDVLRFGCASESSHLFEKKALSLIGFDINTHTTVDLCRIPIVRCSLVETDRRFSFIQADASNLSFSDNSMDLATTDLLLGSMPREKEREILEDVRRVLRPEGNLLMKVMTGDKSKGTPPLDFGLKLRTEALAQYGEVNERDNYIGLTEEQWNNLGQNYNTFIAPTYRGDYKYKSLHEIANTLTGAGFNITNSQKIEDGTPELDKGFFALVAEKA